MRFFLNALSVLMGLFWCTTPIAHSMGLAPSEPTIQALIHPSIAYDSFREHSDNERFDSQLIALDSVCSNDAYECQRLTGILETEAGQTHQPNWLLAVPENRKDSSAGPANGDATAPVLVSASVTPTSLDVGAGQTEVEVSYELQDPGSGLDRSNIYLYRQGLPLLGFRVVQFGGETTASGTTTLTIPSGAAAGDYELRFHAYDETGNNAIITAPGVTVTISNGPTQPEELVVTLSSSRSGMINSAFDVRLETSRPVTGFDTSDIQTENVAATSLSCQNSTSQPLVCTGSMAPASDGEVQVFVPAGVFTDISGTPNKASNALVLQFDGTAPALAISGPAGPVGSEFTVTFTFSESVTGFTVGDVVVSNGTVTNFQASSASTYTALITPNTDGVVTVNVAGEVAVDAAGNGNAVAAQYAVTKITPTSALAATSIGLGTGTITSLPVGITCGTDCTDDFPNGTVVTLTVTADTGSAFASWTSGPCAGSATATCEVTMTADTSVAARFTLVAPPEGRIVAATLPGARSGFVGGNPMTVFMSVVSRQSSPAQGCRITAPGAPPFTLSYRRVDAGNQAIGAADPVFDLGNGGTQSFVIALTPTQATGASGYNFQPAIVCDNAALAPIEGVNSVLVSIGNAPVPDILSIGATPSADGVIRVPVSGNRINFMSAAAVNIGAGDRSAGANEATVTVSVDTGAASLPVTLEVCETPSTGGCSTPRGQASLTTVFEQNSAKFFSVFARVAEGQFIPFDPANARVFLRFTDATGVLRSVTSAAVTSPAPATDAAEMALEGRWTLLVRQDSGEWPSLRRGSLHILTNGQAILASGDHARLIQVGAAERLANGTARFRIDANYGQLPALGTIRLLDAQTDQPGAFWGITDARSGDAQRPVTMVGRYGTITVAEDGSIRGRFLGCSLTGMPRQPSGDVAFSPASVTLSGCEFGGSYTALLDPAANDNDAAALIIANETRGWRIRR